MSQDICTLKDCAKMANLLKNKVVTLDPNTFKYRLPDGQPLIRRADECLLDTIERIQPHRSVKLALQGDIQDYYAQDTRRTYL